MALSQIQLAEQWVLTQIEHRTHETTMVLCQQACRQFRSLPIFADDEWYEESAVNKGEETYIRGGEVIIDADALYLVVAHEARNRGLQIVENTKQKQLGLGLISAGNTDSGADGQADRQTTPLITSPPGEPHEQMGNDPSLSKPKPKPEPNIKTKGDEAIENFNISRNSVKNLTKFLKAVVPKVLD